MAEDINQLLKVRREKLQNLQEAGKDPFKITKCDVTHHSMEIKNNYDELEGKTVTIAGRMMFKRVMGKASFCNTRDLEGDIQAYVARDNIGEDSYKDFKKYDVGDLLCITGEVFKTKTGEISIHASNVTLLSKSLQILPEKFHGLTDTDVRYRQRYVDLIMNAEVKDTFIKRSTYHQAPFVNILMAKDLWKWRPRCLWLMPAVQQHVHLRHILMHLMRILNSAFPLNYTLKTPDCRRNGKGL